MAELWFSHEVRRSWDFYEKLDFTHTLLSLWVFSFMKKNQKKTNEPFEKWRTDRQGESISLGTSPEVVSKVSYKYLAVTCKRNIK